MHLFVSSLCSLYRGPALHVQALYEIQKIYKHIIKSCIGGSNGLLGLPSQKTPDSALSISVLACQQCLLTDSVFCSLILNVG